MSTPLNKIPLSKAKKWADRIVEILAPHCDRIEIAGSIRRQKPTIGDIEIVCIPKRDLDMFGVPAGVCTDFIETVEKWDKVRGDADGRYTQRILPNTNGFTVDIFMADADNWGWIFALRTGSATYVQKTFLRGLRAVDCFAVDGYVYDFTDTLHPKKVSLREESDLFKLIGLDFVQPQERNLSEW